MSPDSIIQQVDYYQKNGKSCFVSTSFQGHSIPLLHILSKCQDKVSVVFIDTGFHFVETLQFRDHIVELLDLNLLELRPSVPKEEQRDENGKYIYHRDPDGCCRINKVMPMEYLLKNHDVWINGVRRVQAETRRDFEVFEKTPFRAVRFQPLVNWSEAMIRDYIREYQLPEHPLQAKGYLSIGCEPCTGKSSCFVHKRSSRWHGHVKTECGLHVDLRSKSE